MHSSYEDLEKLVDPLKYQVFLLTCPAYFPFRFARHPWFVINKKGTMSRWEVVYAPCIHSGTETRWGHIHLDALPPFSGMSFFPRIDMFFGRARLIGSVEGELAEKVAEYIEKSKETYPYRDSYVLTGPNSNTYAKWVLDHFPEWKVQLPWNAFGEKYGTKKIATGVVHGRFQPPHNGHVRYILSALTRAEHVVIGICTPAACTEEEAARTGYPCAPRLNPFTYEERAGMISAALDESGIARDRYSFVPFPSDYQNLAGVIPKDSVFLMSVTGPGDKKKIPYIESLGYKTETVYSIPDGKREERSGLVRDLGKENAGAWESLVPKSIATYMKQNGLLDRLS